MVELQAKKTERGMVVTIGDVLFATNQATPDTERHGQPCASWPTCWTQNPERTVLVEGFTDSTGSDAHNQELSRAPRRLRCAMRWCGMGVAARPHRRCAAMAKRSRWPATIRPANRQLNRRVEIVLSNEGAAIPHAPLSMQL